MPRGEAKLQPRAGDRELVDNQGIIWKEHHEHEPIVNFNRFVGKLCTESVAYAVCYVISETERRDALLQVGTDDLAKVYFNGDEVYKYSLGCPLAALDPVGPLILHEGANRLVLKFKIVTGANDWESCARFVDRDGNPIQGLRISLTPQ